MTFDLELDLIRKHAPLRLAFSGGKDSCVCKWLLQQAGVEFDAFFSNTTMEAPETIAFIRKHHAEVKWRNPTPSKKVCERYGIKYGFVPMMTAVAKLNKVAPTRGCRWCCEVYKETCPKTDRTIVLGVRQWESKRRQAKWTKQVCEIRGQKLLLPILFWTDEEVWTCIRENNIPYCKLYDEGFTRIGCVGCPLQEISSQRIEFNRWPNYERNWKRAIIANWEKWHDVPRFKDGLWRYHHKFKSGEEYWQWWLTRKRDPRNCGFEFPFPEEDPEEAPSLFSDTEDESQVAVLGNGEESR